MKPTSDSITTIAGLTAVIASSLASLGFFPITSGIIAAIAGSVFSYFTKGISKQ
jgi:hypothetical protein